MTDKSSQQHFLVIDESINAVVNNVKKRWEKITQNVNKNNVYHSIVPNILNLDYCMLKINSSEKSFNFILHTIRAF